MRVHLLYIDFFREDKPWKKLEVT